MNGKLILRLDAPDRQLRVLLGRSVRTNLIISMAADWPGKRGAPVYNLRKEG